MSSLKKADVEINWQVANGVIVADVTIYPRPVTDIKKLLSSPAMKNVIEKIKKKTGYEVCVTPVLYIHKRHTTIYDTKRIHKLRESIYKEIHTLRHTVDIILFSSQEFAPRIEKFSI